MSTLNPKLIPIDVPVLADPVERPTVTYGDGPTSIKFPTQDERWARVTFEKLDSIRICRGEYDPYPSEWKPGDAVRWVSEVTPSPWLEERYDYEKTYYGDAYYWTGDVDEMLRDFSHYVFTFHDQFVEVIAAGIWFETFDEDFDKKEPSATHPLRNLPRPDQPDVLEAHDLACEIWPNTRPLDQILEDAKLCSQKLLQFALVCEGSPKPDCTLSVRVRHGKVKSSFRRSLGRDLATFDAAAGLEDVRPYLDAWLAEVKQNRKRAGKA